jgi:hypothetical protein
MAPVMVFTYTFYGYSHDSMINPGTRVAGELAAGGVFAAKAVGKLPFAIESRINWFIIPIKKRRNGLLSSVMQTSDDNGGNLVPEEDMTAEKRECYDCELGLDMIRERTEESQTGRPSKRSMVLSKQKGSAVGFRHHAPCLNVSSKSGWLQAWEGEWDCGSGRGLTSSMGWLGIGY